MTEGDLSGRLNQILSDPASMAKIAELAKSFAAQAPGEGPGPEKAAPEREPAPAEEAPLGREAQPAPDLALLPPGLLRDLTRHSGERAELLRAVRPFLERERQEKLDRVLSLLRTLDLLALMQQ